MTPNSKWITPEPGQPVEPSAESEIVQTPIKPKTPPTPSQVGKFQKAIKPIEAKKQSADTAEEVGLSEEGGEKASLFGLASSYKRIDQKKKPSKAYEQPSLSALPPLVEGEHKEGESSTPAISAIKPTPRGSAQEAYEVEEPPFKPSVGQKGPEPAPSPLSLKQPPSNIPFSQIEETKERSTRGPSFPKPPQEKITQELLEVGEEPLSHKPLSQRPILGKPTPGVVVKEANEPFTRGPSFLKPLQEKIAQELLEVGEEPLSHKPLSQRPILGKPTPGVAVKGVEQPSRGPITQSPVSATTASELDKGGAEQLSRRPIIEKPVLGKGAPQAEKGEALPQGPLSLKPTASKPTKQLLTAPTQFGTKEKPLIPQRMPPSVPIKGEEEPPLEEEPLAYQEGVAPEEETTALHGTAELEIEKPSPVPVSEEVERPAGPTTEKTIPKAKMEKVKTEKAAVQLPPGIPLPKEMAPPVTPSRTTELPQEVRLLTLHQLVEQISSHLSIMTSRHMQEITVDIKYPPLFAGARLTIREFQQAKGEFNLTFENLSPDARLLIESKVQQKRLHDALDEKGYKIHLISVEMHGQTPIFPTEKAGSQKGYSEGGEGGQRQASTGGQGEESSEEQEERRRKR